MPWPARRSPHVDAARSHSRAWARRVGMVSDGEGGAEEAAWSPEEFDRLDLSATHGAGR